jgi:hypothetical protein
METFTMSRKELPRAGLVAAALAGRISNGEGARALRLSPRQFQRLKARVREARRLERLEAVTIELARLAVRPELFVFSDDPGWCASSLRLPCRFTVMDGDRPGHEDLRLMGVCRHHIIANSALSWWDARLGTATGGSVVAPRRWFPDTTLDTQDLIPARWIRL